MQNAMSTNTAFQDIAAPNAPEARGSGWRGGAKLDLLDLCAMVWRERMAAVAIGAAIVALGLVIALLQPRGYGATAQVLVRMGQEYVFAPRVGENPAMGAAPDLSAVTNSELRLVTSPELVRRVLRTMKPETLYPDVRALPEARRLPAAERAFMRHYSASTAPDTPIIALRFEHRDPQIAARTLNTLIDQYLGYRREMLIGGGASALSGEAREAQERYAAASGALQTFLTENSVGDFDTELRATADLAANIETQIVEAQARAREAAARAASLRAQLAQTSAQIELYSDSDARRALVNLQVEREQLLARFQDDAPQVREIDRRISQLQTFLAEGDPPASTRRGPNPVHQQIAGDLAGAQAEARAQADRVAALNAQKAATRERLRALQIAEPRFRQLLRERSVLETSAQNFAVRAEESRALSELTGRSTDNISVLERATPPDKGRSLRWPIMIGAVLIAGAAALAYALGRGFLRRGFPTAGAAARTLDAPVLALLPAAAKANAKPAARLKRKTAA
ncbi:MAG: GumC family protein [Hyphomonadaceae bacterium]